MSRKCIRIGCEPLRIDQHIIVGPDYMTASRNRQRGVTCVAQSKSGLDDPRHWQSVLKFRNNSRGIIGAAIIDNEQLPRYMLWNDKPSQLFQCKSEQFRPIVGADGDRDIHRLPFRD
jgi:hypothetical protein